MTWTLTSSRVPVMPVGSPMPSWSSTTNSWGSTCRISRSMGMETALAASIDAPHVLALDHAVLARDRDHAPRVEAADVGARDAHVGGADLHPGHQLGLLDHALDGVDGGLEVDDHALAQALGLGLADADDVEAALVGDLGHDRADLVGADVQADDVAVFLLSQALPPMWRSSRGLGQAVAVAPVRHRRTEPCDAGSGFGGRLSAASGTRAGGGRAGPRAAARALGCGHRRLLGVDAAAEAQVEVLGVRAALHEVLAQPQEREHALAVGRRRRAAAPRPRRAARPAGRPRAPRRPPRSRPASSPRSSSRAPARCARSRRASASTPYAARARWAGRRRRCAGRRCR